MKIKGEIDLEKGDDITYRFNNGSIRIVIDDDCNGSVYFSEGLEFKKLGKLR